MEKSGNLSRIISIYVDLFTYSLGEEDLLFSFFSSIVVHLENSRWASRFPITMNKFYQGQVAYDELEQFRQELNIIKAEFSKIKAAWQIWNCEKPELKVPEKYCHTDAPNLAASFITTDDNNFFEVIDMAIQDGLDYPSDLSLEVLFYA